MDKKLPGVFKNPIDHHVKNNKNYFYLNKEEEEKNKKELTFEDKVRQELFGSNVEQKINQIFRAPNYIYRAEVEITLKDSVITTKIIGKNNHSLITLDNTLIEMSDILDIKLLK